MLYDQLGVAVFAGLGVMTLSFPCNAVIGHFMRKYQIKQMKLKDKRMKLVAEALSGIKVIKLYAWEESIEQKVEVIRKKELGIIKKFSYIIAAIYFIFNTMPYLVQLTSFWVYIAISDDGYLSPSTAFVSMQLFNLLNFPLSSMSVIIPIFVQAGVAITRLGKYLNNEDMKPDMIWRDPQAEYAVQIMSGEFTWQKGNEIPTLRNINLEVKQGSLVAIVGSVGCGKSSLLSAILGEMEKLKGSVIIKNSIAYVPQEAWIQNATLRNNILFGVEFNQEMYNKTIEACALTADLEILLSGDSTEIGEKGINISGGQKQRVSLARAVYSNNDIYLLDDPLSAVDSHVGKHIFQKVIGQNGVLKDKTRILVTHGIHWLPMVDTIIVMSNGTISEAGTYEDLLARNGTFAQFLKEYVQTDMNTDMENDPEIKAMRRSIFKRFEATENEDESVSLPEEEDSKLSETVVKDKFENMKESSVDEPAIALLAPAGEKLIENELGATGKVCIN
ncbi:unnamed protein product [Lymnaea stagnalis]|uniref:Uncharacterized protein n=1 Tax=Lymnaea stagnalis TaxID=6523 RepID=A0AAV2INY6_LYMST